MTSLTQPSVVGPTPPTKVAIGSGESRADKYLLVALDGENTTTYATQVDTEWNVLTWEFALRPAYRFDFQDVVKARRIATTKGLRTFILKDE